MGEKEQKPPKRKKKIKIDDVYFSPDIMEEIQKEWIHDGILM